MNWRKRIQVGYLELSHMWEKKLTALRIHRRGTDRHKAAFIAQAHLKWLNVEAAQL